MRKYIVLAALLCIATMLLATGCMSVTSFSAPPDKNAETVGISAAIDTEADANITGDILGRLENNETVYYDEITGVSEEKYSLFYRDPKHPRLMQIFDDYNELQKYIVKLIESWNKLSVNVDRSRYVSVYVKEYDNSGYYAVALCNDRKTVFDENGSPVFLESSLNVKTEKDDSKRPVVFALIEKGRYESEAKNPASDISGADNKPVGITEAAKKLDGGQSVRLCDVVLPEKASLSVSTFSASSTKCNISKRRAVLSLLFSKFSFCTFEENLTKPVKNIIRLSFNNFLRSGEIITG